MREPHRRLLDAAKLAYVIVIAGVLAWAFWTTASRIPDWQRWFVDPGALTFVVGWIGMAFLLGFAWARVVAVYLGLRLSFSEWLPIQGAAWAGRYLPGKLGLMAGKLVLLERTEIGWKPLTYSVLFEQLAFLCVGAMLALLVAFPADQWGMTWLMPLYGTHGTMWRLAGVFIATLAFFPLIHLLASRLAVCLRPTIWQAASILALYLSAHIVAGLGLYWMLHSLLPGQSPPPLYAIALLAAANVAGIIAFFAPAGLGIREFALAAGLTPFLPFEEGLALAVVLRLLSTLADVLFSAAAGGNRLWQVIRTRKHLR